MKTLHVCRHCTWAGKRLLGSSKPCPRCGNLVATWSQAAKLPKLHGCGHEVKSGYRDALCGPCWRAANPVPPIDGYVYILPVTHGRDQRFVIR